MNRDPIGEHGGIALYAFVGNATPFAFDFLGLTVEQTMFDVVFDYTLKTGALELIIPIKVKCQQWYSKNGCSMALHPVRDPRYRNGLTCWLADPLPTLRLDIYSVGVLDLLTFMGVPSWLIDMVRDVIDDDPVEEPAMGLSANAAISGKVDYGYMARLTPTGVTKPCKGGGQKKEYKYSADVAVKADIALGLEIWTTDDDGDSGWDFEIDVVQGYSDHKQHSELWWSDCCDCSPKKDGKDGKK